MSSNRRNKSLASYCKEKDIFRKHDGNKVALDLELDRKEKLSKFLNYLTFQILWGFPLDYFKQDIKTTPFN